MCYHISYIKRFFGTERRLTSLHATANFKIYANLQDSSAIFRFVQNDSHTVVTRSALYSPSLYLWRNYSYPLVEHTSALALRPLSTLHLDLWREPLQLSAVSSRIAHPSFSASHSSSLMLDNQPFFVYGVCRGTSEAEGRQK